MSRQTRFATPSPWCGRIFALMGVALIAGTFAPIASGQDTRSVPEEPELFLPTVEATPYEVLDDSGCAGEYAVHSETEVTNSGWWVLFAWKSSTKIEHQSSIDYTFECNVTFASTISGSGGAYRQVGLRAPAGASTSSGVPGLFFSDTWDEELDGGCDYIISHCEFELEVEVSGGATRVEQKERPKEVCAEAPKAEAFNRPQTAWQNLGRLGLVMSELEETKTVNPFEDELCQEIEWTKVDTISVSTGIVGLSPSR